MAIWIVPPLPSAAKAGLPPTSVQAPPVGAVPQPLATVRVQVSVAIVDGGGGGVLPPIVFASKSPKVNRVGLLVVEPEVVARRPMPPADWRAAVEFVALNIQAVGSVSPTSQARATIVDGLAPVTSARTLIGIPISWVRPVATSAPSAVSPAPLQALAPR